MFDRAILKGGITYRLVQEQIIGKIEVTKKSGQIKRVAFIEIMVKQ